MQYALLINGPSISFLSHISLKHVLLALLAVEILLAAAVLSFSPKIEWLSIFSKNLDYKYLDSQQQTTGPRVQGCLAFW